VGQPAARGSRTVGPATRERSSGPILVAVRQHDRSPQRTRILGSSSDGLAARFHARSAATRADRRYRFHVGSERARGQVQGARTGRPSGVCSTSRPTSAVSGRSDSANGQRGARSAGTAAGSVRCAMARRPRDRLARSRCRRSEPLAGDDAGLRPGLRSLRGQRSVAQPGTERRLENYPGRALTWRCSCQSSPAASSASWMRCHAAPSDSSSRMRT
jgi:hypothetical protein